MVGHVVLCLEGKPRVGFRGDGRWLRSVVVGLVRYEDVEDNLDVSIIILRAVVMVRAVIMVRVRLLGGVRWGRFLLLGGDGGEEEDRDVAEGAEAGWVIEPVIVGLKTRMVSAAAGVVNYFKGHSSLVPF